MLRIIWQAVTFTFELLGRQSIFRLFKKLALVFRKLSCMYATTVQNRPVLLQFAQVTVGWTSSLFVTEPRVWLLAVSF